MIITERWFGNSWKEVWLVLYSDSVLAWYDGGDRRSMLGGAKLVLSPDLIAAGQYTANIPDRPDLPSGAGLAQVYPAVAPRLLDSTHSTPEHLRSQISVARESTQAQWTLLDLTEILFYHPQHNTYLHLNQNRLSLFF